MNVVQQYVPQELVQAFIQDAGMEISHSYLLIQQEKAEMVLHYPPQTICDYSTTPGMKYAPVNLWKIGGM